MMGNQYSRSRGGRGARTRGQGGRANIPTGGVPVTSAPHESETSELRALRRILEVNVRHCEFEKSCAEHASSCVKQLRTLSVRVEGIAKELVEFRQALLERGTENAAPTAVQGLGRDRAIEVCTECCSYIRFIMSAALLGKEKAWYVFPSWEHSKLLVEESVRFGLGGTASEQQVQDFLELFRVFDGSGIKELIPANRVTKKKRVIHCKGLTDESTQSCT